MLEIAATEYSITAMRAQGAGGQNVNKVSSAIHLRFEIRASTLSDYLKERLCNLNDSRITAEGVLIIKAQQYRTQEANKKDAIKRLNEIVNAANIVQATRYATRPTYGSQKRRLESKMQRGQIKQMRGKIGKLAPNAKPCTTPAAMRTPVNEPGPAPNAMPCKSCNCKPASTNNNCNCGNMICEWLWPAFTSNVYNASPFKIASDKYSVDVSSASKFILFFKRDRLSAIKRLK